MPSVQRLYSTLPLLHLPLLLSTRLIREQKVSRVVESTIHPVTVNCEHRSLCLVTNLEENRMMMGERARRTRRALSRVCTLSHLLVSEGPLSDSVLIHDSSVLFESSQTM